jgi:hypothetical protein
MTSDPAPAPTRKPESEAVTLFKEIASVKEILKQIRHSPEDGDASPPPEFLIGIASALATAAEEAARKMVQREKDREKRERRRRRRALAKATLPPPPRPATRIGAWHPSRGWTRRRRRSSPGSRGRASRRSTMMVDATSAQSWEAGGGAGVKLPHRRGAGPSFRSRVARIREEQWMENEQPARYRELVGLLRREVGSEQERVLIGYDAIALWLDSVGIVNRYGQRVTPKVVQAWRRRSALPVLRGRCAWPGRAKASPCWTTTLLLQAWLASLFRSGGACGPHVRKSTTPGQEAPGVRGRPPSRPHPLGSSRPARVTREGSLL